MTITPEGIEKLRELEKKATPGPWSASDRSCSECKRTGTSEWSINGPPGGYHDQFGEAADAAFIAAARNALPALLSAYETEKAAREKAEAALATEKATSLEEMQEELDIGVGLAKRVGELCAERDRERARADRLAKALEPFAALGRRYRIPPYGEADSIELPIKCVDLRSAALAEGPKETGNG